MTTHARRSAARTRAAAPPALAAILVLGATLAALPGPLGAQQDAVELARVTEAFAVAWQEGDLDGVSGRMSAGGILLHLPDAVHPVLSHRLAVAALVDLHGRAGRGPVSVRQNRLLGGTPPRAFLEMTWAPVPPGLSEPLDYTVFAGLEERGGDWWVVEIRVLPPRDPGGAPARAWAAPAARPDAPDTPRSNPKDGR